MIKIDTHRFIKHLVTYYEHNITIHIKYLTELIVFRNVFNLFGRESVFSNKHNKTFKGIKYTNKSTIKLPLNYFIYSILVLSCFI